MKVRDGFKFGIGLALANGVIYAICGYVDKESRIHRQVDRIIAAWTGKDTEANQTTDIPVTTVKNKIGFTIE